RALPREEPEGCLQSRARLSPDDRAGLSAADLPAGFRRGHARRQRARAVAPAGPRRRHCEVAVLARRIELAGRPERDGGGAYFLAWETKTCSFSDWIRKSR